MLTGPAHGEDRKVWGRVAAFPRGLPGVIQSESGRSRLEGKMPHSHVLGAGAVSRQLLEVVLVLTLKAGVALVKSGCVVRGPALCWE